MMSVTLIIFILSFIAGCVWSLNGQRNLGFSTFETISWTFTGGIVGLGLSVGIWLMVTNW